MKDYTYKLVLAYLNQVDKNYDFDELRRLIGKDSNYLDSILIDMKNRQYIFYDDYEIIVSKKGKAFLVSNDCLDYKFEESEYSSKSINPKIAMPITELYIPQNFLDKI